MRANPALMFTRLILFILHPFNHRFVIRMNFCSLFALISHYCNYCILPPVSLLSGDLLTERRRPTSSPAPRPPPSSPTSPGQTRNEGRDRISKPSSLSDLRRTEHCSGNSSATKLKSFTLSTKSIIAWKKF